METAPTLVNRTGDNFLLQPRFSYSTTDRQKGENGSYLLPVREYHYKQINWRG